MTYLYCSENEVYQKYIEDVEKNIDYYCDIYPLLNTSYLKAKKITIPIIEYAYNNGANINIIYYTINKCVICDYFKENYNEKQGYFLYCVIINLSLKMKLYGGVLRDIIKRIKINDLDFSYSNTTLLDRFRSLIYDIYMERDRFLNMRQNYNIDLIIRILYKLIFKKIIICDTINFHNIEASHSAIKIKYENIEIDTNCKCIDISKNNYDFYENTLSLKVQLNDKNEINTTLSSMKEYNYNKELLLLLVSSLCKISNVNILNIILSMLGDNYLCVLESCYYISKNKLRVIHDNNCSILHNLKKIIFIRIPKFREKNYKIILGENCNCKDCICKTNNKLNTFLYDKKILYMYYKYMQYTVDFSTFADNFYTLNSHRIFNKTYKYVERKLYHIGSTYLQKQFPKISKFNPNFKTYIRYKNIEKKKRLNKKYKRHMLTM